MDQYGPKLLKGEIGSGKAAPAAAATEEPEAPLQGLEEGDAFGDGIPFGDPYWYSDWQSPYYDESHRKVRAVVRRYISLLHTTLTHLPPSRWVEKHAMVF